MQTIQPLEGQILQKELHQDKRLTEELSKTVTLDIDIINSSLCYVNETIDGLSYAPAKFICNDKMLTDISALKGFIFLRYINIGFNRLTNLRPLYGLINLIVLRAAHNEIEEFPCGNWPTLAHLDLSHNCIKKLTTVNYPRLLVLLLDNNQLRTLTNQTDGLCCLNDHSVPKLHTLGLSHNLIETEDNITNDSNIIITSIGLELKSLKALYLGFNKLISCGNYKLKGENLQTELTKYSTDKIQNYSYNSLIGYLPNLSVLNIRSTGLLNLDGITPECLPGIEYLNLRENQIGSLEEIKKLSSFQSLRTVILTDNPVCDVKDYRLEVRVSLLNLRRLDKDVYTTEENEEADDLAMQRMQAT
ncbi:Leucine-rich repeat-containing protein [Schistosoma japonicum]|uniref:Leucine-rich repeat-containing protein n=1 Tax=Schistosoma japonicum TaxID=6182 RepID=A0A4Z2DKD8_SCHJA|nr:Leucine-rich repeat-containing protein [Schistosoma japonicum]